MKIEIITTPNEKLKETGFGSLKACENVLEVLQQSYDVKLNVCKDKNDLDNIIDRKPDLIVLAVKYIVSDRGRNIWLADFFENKNVNFTGSINSVLNFDSNKVSAKAFLKNKGIKTADYFTATSQYSYNHEDELPIKFPLFLKPLESANGNGIDEKSLVKDFNSFKNKVKSIFDTFDQTTLVEKYLEGREFTVAIIENRKKQNLFIAPIEIIPPLMNNGSRILGEKVKQENSEKLKSIIDTKTKSKVETLATEVFKLLNIRDFGRIDIKMDGEGECYFVEVNLVPGMTKGSSYFPRAFEIAQKIDYDSVVKMMIESSINRK